MCNVIGSFIPTKHTVIIGEDDHFNQWFRVFVGETEVTGSITKTKDYLDITLENKHPLQEDDVQAILAQSGLGKHARHMSLFSKDCEKVKAIFELC